MHPPVLHALLERAVRHESMAREAAMLQRQAGYQGTLLDMVGSPEAMQQVFALIEGSRSERRLCVDQRRKRHRQGTGCASHP